MYAIDDLGDAIDVTRDFLTPIDPWTWFKLAIVVFFVTGISFGGPPGTGGGEFTTEEDPFAGTEFEGDFVIDLTLEELVTIVLVVAAIAFALWLFFALVGAIMEFVLVESLRTTAVNVRQYGRANFGRAIQLFAFRVVLGGIGFALVLLATLGVLQSAESIDAIDAAAIVPIIAGVFLYFLFYSLVMKLTTEFVVPVMLVGDRGILGAWRRFASTLAGSPLEYVAYLIIVVIVQFVLAIAVGFVALFGGLLIAIPTVVVAVVFAALGGTIGFSLAALTAFVGVLVFLLFLALVQVPIVTYLRYYALLLLGDTDSDLDLIPTQRAGVRSGGWDDGGRNGADERGPQWDDGDDWDRSERDDSSASDWGGTDDGSSDWDDSNAGGRDHPDDEDDGDGGWR